MELSTLIGKPVLSPAGETLGYVKSAYVAKNMNAVSSLVCVDGEEEEFYLPIRAVLSAEDAVIAGSARLTAPAGNYFPLGAPVYTNRGEYLGTAAELGFFQDGARLNVTKNGQTVGISTDRLVFQDAVIVYPERAKRPALPRKKQTKTDQPTEYQAEPQQTAAVCEPCKQQKNGECCAADKKTAQESPYTNDLLGKRLKRALTDANGEELICAGEEITPASIRLAARHNRLLELSANTFGN